MHQHDISVVKTSGNGFNFIIKHPCTARFDGTSFSFFQCYNCQIFLFYHIVFYAPTVSIVISYMLLLKPI